MDQSLLILFVFLFVRFFLVKILYKDMFFYVHVDDNTQLHAHSHLQPRENAHSDEWKLSKLPSRAVVQFVPKEYAHTHKQK